MRPCGARVALASILIICPLAGAEAGNAPGDEAPRRPARRTTTRAPSRKPEKPASLLPRQARSLGAAPRYTGEPISLDLKDADLKDVLRTFGKLTGLNLAIDPEVKGSITVRLVDVPWDQALELILRMNGLGYTLEGNVVRVGLPSKL
jgi:type IV pilus assembly protein PilQ